MDVVMVVVVVVVVVEAKSNEGCAASYVRVHMHPVPVLSRVDTFTSPKVDGIHEVQTK
jgi:hypothetical protein